MLEFRLPKANKHASKPNVVSYDQSFIASSFSERGMFHHENQDALLCNPEQGLFLIADGLGSEPKGKVASLTVVNFFEKELPHIIGSECPVGCINQILIEINAKLFRKDQQDTGSNLTASTIVLLWIDKGQYHIYWLGHSRCYLLRDDHFIQKTKDHNLSKNPGILTKALGLKKGVVTAYTNGRLEENDTFLLCSDGLTAAVPNSQIEHILKQPQDDLEVKSQALLSQALQSNNNNDLTGILVQYHH